MNWPIYEFYVSNPNWRQLFTCHNIHIFSISSIKTSLFLFFFWSYKMPSSPQNPPPTFCFPLLTPIFHAGWCVVRPSMPHVQLWLQLTERTGFLERFSISFPSSVAITLSSSSPGSSCPFSHFLNCTYKNPSKHTHIYKKNWQTHKLAILVLQLNFNSPLSLSPSGISTCTSFLHNIKCLYPLLLPKYSPSEKERQRRDDRTEPLNLTGSHDKFKAIHDTITVIQQHILYIERGNTQGSKGIRHWPIIWCTSSMMI